MKRIFRTSCIAIALAASALAIAQTGGYTGPSSTGKAPAAAGYTGPSNVPLMTAKELLDKGRDDQYVKLQGKLLSNKGGEHYEFADQSGRITVEIDDEDFPQGVSIDQNTVVELVGEFDKETFGESTLEVKQIKVVGR